MGRLINIFLWHYQIALTVVVTLRVVCCRPWLVWPGRPGPPAVRYQGSPAEHTHLAPAFVWLSSKQWRHCKPGNFPVSQYRQTSHSPPCKHRDHDNAQSPDVAVWRAGGAARPGSMTSSGGVTSPPPATTTNRKNCSSSSLTSAFSETQEPLHLTSKQRESGAVAVTAL